MIEKKDIDRFLREMGQAMITADASRLNRMIDDNIVFRHITGLTQTKGQWLTEIERGTMRYHKIKSTIERISPRSSGHVHVSILTTLTATAWSAFATWHLRIVMNLRQNTNGGIMLMAQRKTLLTDKMR